MTSKGLVHFGVMIEFFVSIMEMSIKDMHYTYTIDFLQEQFRLNCSKIEDVKFIHSVMSKLIIEETLEHLD